MEFLTITSPATDRFIGALCNTLVHSLWQGLILAAVTGLIVLLTRKSTATLRYNLLIAALTLFAVGTVITFMQQMGKDTVTLISTTAVVTASENVSVIQINTSAPSHSFSADVLEYLNQYHNTIVLVWFLIICAKSIQLAVGLLGVRRLKHVQVHQASIEWYNKLQSLADKLEIKKCIALLESGLAKVPMVIGTFKPVILIPIGLLTALSTEEIEAILVHELAHIKRRDYLVNLLQSLMEIVFFFNPAVLWISQLIKAERENCCDDAALAQSNNKVNYIRALVSCEEFQAAVPAYAMRFAGDKNTLINRVKRIASNRNHSLNLFEKTALAICLVVSGLCMSAFTHKEKLHRITDALAQAISHKKTQDLKPAKAEVSSTEIQKLNTQTNLVKEQSSSLISQPDTAKKGLEKALENHTVTLTADPAGEITIPAGVKFNATPGAVINVDDDGVTHITANQKVSVTTDAKVLVSANPKVGMVVDTPKAAYQLRTNIYGVTSNVSPVLQHANLSLNTSLADVKGITSNRPFVTQFSASLPDTNKWRKTNNQVVDGSGLIRDVMDAHAIKNENNFKIILNNKELIVDGVKQPEDLHQKVLKTYVKHPDDKVDVTITVSN